MKEEERRRYDVVVAGHLCLDLIPEMSGEVVIRPGTLIETGQAILNPGGAVANVGTALDRLGVRTAMVARVGGDILGNVTRDLLDKNAPTAAKLLATDERDNSSYTIVLNVNGQDRVFFHSPGANRVFVSADVPDSILQEAAHLHFGYPPLMESIYRNSGEELKQIYARAKRNGLTTSLDLSFPDEKSESGRIDWPDFLANVLPAVDYFFPSVEELLFMLDRPRYTQLCKLDEIFRDRDAIRWAAAQSLELGARNVIVKLGSEGLYLANREREIWQPVYPVEVKGTTGSGDATIAGFLCALVEGKPLEQALKLGSAVGSFCCEEFDAVSGIPDRNGVQARFEAT